MSLSNQCILEISDLSTQAQRLARGSQSQRKEADVLLQRITNLRQIGLSSDEIRAKYAHALTESIAPNRSAQEAEYRQKFEQYLASRLDEIEMRDFQAGTQSVSWTEGTQGGYLVPVAYDPTVREAMAQVDPLLSEDVTSFSMTDGPFLQPEQISGYDLSTVTAQIVSETVQQTAQPIPPALGGVLRSDIIFKTSFAASIEAQIDIPNFAQKITRAASVALARKIGRSVVSGRGGTDIAGFVKALGSPSVNNQTAGKLTLTDFQNIFFGIDKWYRAAPRCGWLMNDTVYKYVRAAVDNSGRPLLSVEDDRETLYGKPVYVSPSLATVYTSLGIAGVIIFGDLASIVIRASRPSLQRAMQLSEADITRGQCLYIGRCRADASYFDPSSGVTPPLVMAAIS